VTRKAKPKARRKAGKRKGPLASWVKAEGKSLTACAELFGCSVQHVSNLLHGHTAAPSRELAVTIERVTDGAVPVSAW
jgi:transcriptional regulator with XRE-family HTH domain